MKTRGLFVLFGLLFLAFAGAASCWAGPLHEAAAKGDIAQIKTLLSQNPSDINAKDNLGQTPLDLAILNTQQATVEYLVSHGADIQIKDSNEMAPLHWAAFMGNKETARLLISKGAFVNVKNKVGWIPLNIAIVTGHLELVQFLLENGADYLIKDKDGNTPKQQARLAGYKEIADLLEKYEVLPNKKPIAADPSAPAIQPELPGMKTTPWSEVISIKGDSGQITKPFAVGSEWRLLWETQPSPTGKGNISITVCRQDGKTVAICASGVSSDHNETKICKEGTFYLEINASQPYIITVLDKQADK